MIRDIAAVIAGLAAAIVLIFLVQKVGHILYPPPPDIDINDVEAARTYISQLPLLALLFPIFSYFVGAFAGSMIACRIGTERPKVFAGIIGLVLLAFTIGNLVWIPHPHWFSALAVAAVLTASWLAMSISPTKTT